MSLLFKLLAKVSPDTIDAYIRQRWVKPVDFKELNFVFADDEGRAWYEYPDGMANPIKRIEQQTQFVSLLSSRISPEALEITYKAITESFNKGDYITGLTTFKRFMEMRDAIIPMDVLINSIAADLIREDESLTDINPVIHQEKCDYLMKVAERGDGFFFRLKGVKGLSERFKISDNGWKVISKGFRESLLELKKEYDLIRSMKLDETSPKSQPNSETSSESTSPKTRKSSKR